MDLFLIFIHTIVNTTGIDGNIQHNGSYYNHSYELLCERKFWNFQSSFRLQELSQHHCLQRYDLMFIGSNSSVTEPQLHQVRNLLDYLPRFLRSNDMVLINKTTMLVLAMVEICKNNAHWNYLKSELIHHQELMNTLVNMIAFYAESKNSTEQFLLIKYALFDALLFNVFLVILKFVPIWWIWIQLVL